MSSMVCCKVSSVLRLSEIFSYAWITVVWLSLIHIYPEIFDDVIYDFNVLSQRLRELAFLNKGINITLIDKREDKKEVFHYEGGIKSFVSY